MNIESKTRLPVVLLALCLSSCASMTDDLVSSPHVNLRDVQLVGLDFNRQTFLLSFDVTNPNPFSLPVRSVGYGVKLDGQYFASGETTSEFRVPADGNASFAISVDLDLLKTAPQLLSIVRDGAREDIHYDLEGRFGVDLPFVPILKFSDSGVIRVTSSRY
ncbi:MAG: LEA type 2 family protein [Gammaproteobacteria bacterium]|nr:LEA type 2 family protein [Gammaproteobacteria bacterium]